MPRGRKPTKKIILKSKKSPKIVKSPGKEKLTRVSLLKQSLFEQLKLSESYVSLILGAVVVLALSVVFFIFLKGNNSLNSTRVLPANDTITGLPASVSVTPFISPSPTAQEVTERTYILQADESLWDVAVKFYGDGFRWVDIARINNLEETADYVPPGTSLIVP